jgi:replicative DNA helicase
MENSKLYIPHDLEGEQAVLGAILFDNSLISKIAQILTPNSFYGEAHRHIFRAMLELFEIKSPIDEILLGDQLKSFGKIEEIGGYAYLAELVECVPVTGNIEYYARVIREHAQLRDLIMITADIGRKSRDPQQSLTGLLVEAETKIREIALSHGNKEYQHIKDVIVEDMPRLEKLSENKNDIIGLKSGIFDLDMMTAGFQPGDLIIIAGRPSMGKSALALNICEYASLDKVIQGGVYIGSLEMENTKLARRLLASNARIDSRKLKTGNLQQEDWDKLIGTVNLLSGAEIYLNDMTYNIDQICYSVRNLHRSIPGGLKTFILDYLQLSKITETKGKTRDQVIGEMSREMKLLAKDLNIPIIVLSQLNRSLENRPNKRPQLSDLRESGSIEQDADIILFIYRDIVYTQNSDYGDIAELILAKQREGPTGTIPVKWIPKFTKFTNLESTEKSRFFSLMGQK